MVAQEKYREKLKEGRGSRRLNEFARGEWVGRVKIVSLNYLDKEVYRNKDRVNG